MLFNAEELNLIKSNEKEIERYSNDPFELVKYLSDQYGVFGDSLMFLITYIKNWPVTWKFTEDEIIFIVDYVIRLARIKVNYPATASGSDKKEAIKLNLVNVFAEDKPREIRSEWEKLIGKFLDKIGFEV